MSSFTERLIEIVKKYPILYDLGHLEYKNARKRDKIWDEIALELNESGDEVKKKWKNIRDSYAKHLKSLKTKTGQSTKKNYKNWQWASLMVHFKPFLLAFDKTASNVGKVVNTNDSKNQIMNDTDDVSSCSVHVKKEDVVTFDSNQKNNECGSVNTNNDGYNSRTILDVSASSSVLTTPSTSNQRHMSSKAEKRFASSVDKEIDYVRNKKQKNELSPTEMIFLGYAQTIQTFSPRRQSYTKLKIAEIVTQQEFEHLTEYHNYTGDFAFDGNN